MLLTVGVCVLLILLALFQVMPPKEHGKGKGKGTAAVDSDGILCGSSDSDSSEAPSLSTVNTSTTRSSNSSRNSLKKTKKLKKKSKKKKDKSCDFCDSIVEDPCPLQELLNLQMSTHVEKTIMWGRPNKEGNQCYMCKRTRRVKVRWSVLTSADLKEELNDDTNKDEFLTDRDAVVSLLAEKGPNERISLDDLDQRIEVLHDEAAGERAWRAGTKFSEGVFNSRFSLEEQKKMDFKKESQKNLRTGKVELFYRVFDDEEGVERFESYQDRKTSKRRKLGDTIASNEDQEETFDAAARAILETTTKSGVTRADLSQVGKLHKLEPKSKSARKQDDLKKKQERKLKKNDSTASSHSDSIAPLGINATAKKAKPKGKAKAKPGVAVPSGAPVAAEQASSSGFKLERPADGKDAKFMSGVDARLRDARQAVICSLQIDSLHKFKDDDFVSHIRKLSGVEAKVKDMGWTFAKKAIDEVLTLMRSLQALIKGLKAFEMKRQTNRASSVLYAFVFVSCLDIF